MWSDGGAYCNGFLIFYFYTPFPCLRFTHPPRCSIAFIEEPGGAWRECVMVVIFFTGWLNIHID